MRCSMCNDIVETPRAMMIIVAAPSGEKFNWITDERCGESLQHVFETLGLPFDYEYIVPRKGGSTIEKGE